ncbi:uncharacterized protein P884DRAFT_300782 [Thermothelomyces heterothallicus CBS 202.75]|uniref:uncharacterized protein n=1 Tax=Thermothelomyces heterothallicus CBS 202.75 TaxID=1149848 RepID=UPI003743D5E6
MPVKWWPSLIVIIIIGCAIIGYDFAEALSHLDKRAGPFYRALLDDQHYMLRHQATNAIS